MAWFPIGKGILGGLPQGRGIPIGSSALLAPVRTSAPKQKPDTYTRFSENPLKKKKLIHLFQAFLDRFYELRLVRVESF